MKIYFLQKKILKLLFSVCFFVQIFCAGFAMQSNHGLDGYVENKIDPIKNARLHNNMGNIYFDEKKYIGALKEYEIAYNLAHKTQAAGAYLYNISRCYFVLGNYNLAKNAILGAIKKDCINLTYYEMLAECIIKLNQVESELEKYINDSENPYNRIVVALIYLKTDKKMQARATLDDFVAKYPNLIITDDIRLMLNRI